MSISTQVELYIGRTLDEKLEHLEGLLRAMGRVMVGYSGGVDSALLAVAAHRVLGADAIAVTAESESYPAGELELARALMRQFGIRHEVVRTAELQNPNYASNPVDRCYFCKQDLFAHLQKLAAELEVPYILYGQNADDAGDFRPGAMAARDRGVRAPLQEAGFTKQDIRELARRWGMPVWDRPATACLASRFPYGTPITAETLRLVDQAENAVRARGFTQLRARHHGELVRLELLPEELPRLLEDASLREAIRRELVSLGYGQVSADLRGFRSGSMNEVLKPAADQQTNPEEALQGLAGLDLGRVEWSRRGQVLFLRLEEGTLRRLADSSCRLQVLQALENAGCRYLAFDLEPLT